MQYFHVSSITAILCNKKIRHKAKAETKICKSTWHPSKGPAKYSCFRSKSLKQVNSCNPKFQGLGAKNPNNLNLLRNLVIGLFWKKLVILMGFRCPELGAPLDIYQICQSCFLLKQTSGSGTNVRKKVSTLLFNAIVINIMAMYFSYTWVRSSWRNFKWIQVIKL